MELKESCCSFSRNDEDESYMQRALELAERGMGKTSPNPMVGAVLVKDGRIIGEGYHKRWGEAHAEVNAIHNATDDVEGATLYVNLEPCSHYGRTPPCSDLIIGKRIGRVVIGSLDPNPLVAGKGIEKLRAAGIETVTGVLESRCLRLNEVFLHYITAKRPYVVLKSAVSLDGKTAAPTGESKWITGEAARNDVQLLRNRYAAIMTGVDTVICDDPRLTCRIQNGNCPARIILDSNLRIPLNSIVLKNQNEHPTMIAALEDASSAAAEKIEAMGVTVLRCKSFCGRVDLSDLMEKLGALSIDSVLLEGGATLNEAAFVQGILQKLILYVAPKIIGGAGSKTFVGGVGIGRLEDAYQVKIDSVEQIGGDLKITAYIR